MMGHFDGMAEVFAETFGEETGATYTPPGGSAVSCRPIVMDRDPTSAEFSAKPRRAGRMVAVLKSEVAAPVADGVFAIGSETFTIVGKPTLQRPELAMWLCQTA